MEQSGCHRFLELFCRNRPKYCRFAVSFIRDQHAAEDLVNDSFLQVWEKRTELEDNNIESYYYTILKNCCLKWLRKRATHCKAHQRIYDDSFRMLLLDIRSLDAYDPNLIFRNEVQAIMQRQLNRMPDLTRKIFTDNRFHNLSYEEIAKKYGINKSKVVRDIESALCSLRIALQDYLPAMLMISVLLHIPLFNG